MNFEIRLEFWRLFLFAVLQLRRSSLDTSDSALERRGKKHTLVLVSFDYVSSLFPRYFGQLPEDDMIESPRRHPSDAADSVDVNLFDDDALKKKNIYRLERIYAQNVLIELIMNRVRLINSLNVRVGWMCAFQNSHFLIQIGQKVTDSFGLW